MARPSLIGAWLLACLPLLADTSPRRPAADYRRFGELFSVGIRRAWYVTPGARYVALQSGADVLLIDAASGQEYGKLTGHAQSVHDAGFSADGRFIATAGTDATVKVWDVSTLKEVRSVEAHDGFA